MPCLLQEAAAYRNSLTYMIAFVSFQPGQAQRNGPLWATM